MALWARFGRDVSNRLPQLCPGIRQSSSSTPRRGRPPKHQVTSLDPRRLNVGDLVDLSGQQRSCIAFTTSSNTPSTEGPSRAPRNVLVSFQDFDSPFPPGTHGLFYFHRRLHTHVAAGELRFRTFSIDSISDQAELQERFDTGSDLADAVNPSLPWKLSLLSLATSSRPTVYNLLMKQNLITPSMDQKIQDLLAKFREGSKVQRFHHRLRSQVVERITDPFVLDFNTVRQNYIFLHEEAILRCTWKYGFAPYSGKALVRLEAARGITGIPGTNVVMRLLRFVQSPSPTDEGLQREGELVKRAGSYGERVWTAFEPARFITPSSMKILEETYLNT